jgi:hypothetical protein
VTINRDMIANRLGTKLVKGTQFGHQPPWRLFWLWRSFGHTTITTGARSLRQNYFCLPRRESGKRQPRDHCVRATTQSSECGRINV